MNPEWGFWCPYGYCDTIRFQEMGVCVKNRKRPGMCSEI
jgi:hypothetical protein